MPTIDKCFVMLIVSIGIVYTPSCKKSSNEKPPQSVVWSIDGGTNQSADTISFIKLLGTAFINATKGTTKIYVGISSTAVGVYSKFNGNADVGLIIAGALYNDMSSNVAITSNSNSRLSGSFNGTLILGTLDTVTLSGTFKDVQYYY